MKSWKEPREVDAVTAVFPASVIGNLLPEVGELGDFRDKWNTDPWCRQASIWFMFGIDPEKSIIEYADHIDTELKQRNVWLQLEACLHSYEPSHEHKMAGVGYLMSLFFKSLELVGIKK